MIRRFLDANVRLSGRLQRRLESGTAFYRRYDTLVAQAAASLPDRSTVVDLGGGRRCSFADRVDRSGGTRIVAVDVSAEELAANRVVDEARVGNVATGLPLAEGEADLLVSRTVLEHVSDVPAAARHMADALGPGATTLHLLPCRYALFAVVARLVPLTLAKRILHLLIPSSRGIVEFEVFYDHCHPGALERAFSGAGFRTVEVEPCWAQAEYFAPLFPAFVLVALYQSLARRLKIRPLAAYAIVRAVR